MRSENSAQLLFYFSAEKHFSSFSSGRLKNLETFFCGKMSLTGGGLPRELKNWKIYEAKLWIASYPIV